MRASFPARDRLRDAAGNLPLASDMASRNAGRSKKRLAPPDVVRFYHKEGEKRNPMMKHVEWNRGSALAPLIERVWYNQANAHERDRLCFAPCIDCPLESLSHL
jgi:hypothetical protein